ncbi:hypothetical protein ABMA27_012134 [Loxostege sticticalis]|uniref:Uncharacterized protein n=1 Tax=Loxostege sticticalis TaxID=481309 RepID=A0ABR3IIV1_LOXSC
MPYVKNTSYTHMPFSSETASVDFYIYYDIKDLAKKCELLRDEVTRCRTIGVLQSIHGKFYLTELNPEPKNSHVRVQISVIYLKTQLPSTVIPYPVQVFGNMQWKNRPVIYAKLIKVLNTSMALRMRDTMNSTASMHLARQGNEKENELNDSLLDKDCNDSLFDGSFNISNLV